MAGDPKLFLGHFIIRTLKLTGVLTTRGSHIDVCHGTAALLQFDQTHKENTPLEEQTKSSKCNHFENCNFYKDLYGELARLARSAHPSYKTL